MTANPDAIPGLPAKPRELRLVLLVLGALLPVLLLGGWLIGYDAVAHREEMRTHLSDTARALGLALDKQVEVSVAALRVLAQSRSVAGGDFARFTEIANALIKGRPEWNSVILADPSGQQLVNLSAPLGSLLPRISDPELVERVVRTGGPAVSSLFVGAVTKRPTLLVAVPVFSEGAVRYVIAANIGLESLGDLLRRQHVPGRWLAGVVDARGSTVVAAGGAETPPGTPAPAWLAQGIGNAGEGRLAGPWAEGNEVEVAFRRMALAPWTLVLVLPAEIVQAPVRRAMINGLLLGLGLLGVSAAVTVIVERRIRRHVQAQKGDAAARVGAEAAAVRRVSGQLAAATERERRLGDDLRRAEQDFRLVTSVGRLIAFKLDADFRFTWISGDALGLTSSEVLGNTPDDLFDAGTALTFAAVFRRVWESGRGERAAIGVRRLGQSFERHIDLMVEPMFAADGAALGLTGVAHDVTQHVRARREAERANEAKSRFLAAASHDLRQPVQAMRLLLHLMTEKAVAEPELARIAARIGVALDGTERMLGRLMEFTALESGKVAVAGQVFRLDELVMRIVAEAAPEAERRHLRLRGRVFPCATVSDPVLLERILRNLIANAIRYTPTGGILVGLRRRGRAVRVVVYDTGCGIPADKQSVIFEEFRQLDNLDRERSRGMGLGLATVARMAELLGHRLDLVSEEYRGSAFSVEVPLLPPSTATVQASLDLPYPTAMGAKLLLVEDDPMQAMALASILGTAGFHVVIAGGSLQAEQALQRAMPDLIVSDFRLPDGASGLDVIRAARQRFERFIPAMLVTGDTQSAIVEEAAMEACAVVHKPYSPQALLDAINRCLAESRTAPVGGREMTDA